MTVKHGFSKHPQYSRWKSMNERCSRPTHQAWRNYGGRGITVCKEWSFDAGPAAFILWTDGPAADGSRFSPDLELDRIDNDGPYSPENCRWVTASFNRRNQRKYNRPRGYARGWRKR